MEESNETQKAEVLVPVIPVDPDDVTPVVIPNDPDMVGNTVVLTPRVEPHVCD